MIFICISIGLFVYIMIYDIIWTYKWQKRYDEIVKEIEDMHRKGR